MNINGFEVDKYNVHNLPELKDSICILCSHKRKPENQKKRCATPNWLRGLAYCHHCGKSFQLHTFKSKNGVSSPHAPVKEYVRTETPKTQIKEYTKPKRWTEGNLTDEFVSYWKKRGISKETLELMKVSTCYEWMPKSKKEVQVMQFPYFKNREIINVKYRGTYTNPEGKKERDFKLISGAQKIPYNIDGIKTDNECIIVEGEPDVLTFIECGYANVISSPNGSTLHGVNLEWLDEHIEYFENKEVIYVGMDNDEAGQNVQKELIRRLGIERVRVIDYGEYKDANATFTKNGTATEFDENAIYQLIKNAKEMPLESVVRFNDIADEIVSFFKDGLPKGNVCGIESLDEVFSWNFGQYCMVTGIPTHGKSTVVDQMLLGYVRNYGYKIAYCSPENLPLKIHIGKLVTKILGYVPTVKQIESKEYKMCAQFIQDHFDFVVFEKGCNLTTTLNKFRELVKRRGTRIFVIDPINKVQLNESRTKSDVQYAQDYSFAIDEFVKETNSFAFVIAHPVKQTPDKGVFPKPNPYSIKGGGDWLDMTYHMLCVHRDYVDQITEIDVFKCKFDHLGKNGAVVKLKYNGKNSRLSCLNGTNLDSIETRTANHDYTNWVTNLLSEQGAMYEYEEKTDWNNMAKPLVEEQIPF